jgi:hypothetical protein
VATGYRFSVLPQCAHEEKPDGYAQRIDIVDIFNSQ